MTTFDALGLPIFATTDKIAATGDGLREDLNLISASAGNAISAEGARAQADATVAAKAYTDSNKFKRGTIPAGTDIYSYEGSGKDGVYASLLASNTATLLNLPTELVTSPRPFILTVKTLTNTVVLTIEIISVTGTVTYKANSSPSTGTGWTVWERQLNDKDLPALTPGDDGPETVTTPSAFKNVALALTVPANASATESVPAASLRYPIKYGAPFARWRFHIQNINDRSGTTYPGAVAFTGAWFGAGSHSTGNGTGAPAKVADAFTLPEDGSEYVSPWVTSAPVAAGTSYHLSFGYTADVAQVNTQSTAAVWRTTTPSNASVASPSGQTLSTDSPFSVWIEAEVPAGIPVVGMLGASGPAGVGSTLPVLESPVSIYARSIGALPMHYAHPGSTLAIWKDETHQKWRKWLGYARPDALIIDGASNDVYGSNALSIIQADTATVLDIAARLATPNLYAMTVHPRDNTTDEAKRRDYNTWLKTLPLGFRDVFDQSAAVSSDDETVMPAYYADGVHTNTAGATAKAGAITRQVVTTPAAPTKAALGLDQVDNTSDANKPVSGPQAAIFAAKADLFAYVKVGQDIQAAINAASGKVLLVTAGTYTAANINVSGNVELWCEPGTVIKQAAASDRQFIQITTPGTKLTMRGGTIDQNNANQTARSGKFAFHSDVASVNAEFHGVTFKDSCEGAIRFLGDRSGATRETLKLVNCKFRGGTESESNLYDTFTVMAGNGSELIVEGCDFDHGLTLTKQGIPAITVQATITTSPEYTKLTVRNSTFRGYGRFTSNSGVGVIDFYVWGESLDIEGNKFYDTMNAPIRGKTNVKNAIIRGNQLLSFVNTGVNFGGGINIVRATIAPVIGNLEIASNIIVGAPERGIEVSNDTGAMGLVRVHDNQVSGCGGTSIYLMGLTDFNIHDNTLTSGSSTGVVFTLCSGSGSISKNIITGMAGQGIINNSAQATLDIQVHDNLVTNATTAGISVEDVRYLSLQGNTVKDVVDIAVGQRGYRIGGSAGIATAHIKNNTAIGTFGSGAFSVTSAGIATRYEEGNTWNHRVSHTNVAPTTGTYSRGDIVWNTSPSASGNVGWICTTAGSPGTWKTFGVIGA